MKEIWKNIDGYDGGYQISNHGRIKSFKKSKEGKILKLNLRDGKYYNVSLWNNKKQKCLRIHNLVWEAFGDKPRKGLQIDHIDRNKLNNKIDNLRLVTNQQNNQNKPGIKNKTSKFKGVCWSKPNKKWRASIGINSKQTHLGLFIKEKEAAEAYNSAALKHFGEYAYLNDI